MNFEIFTAIVGALVVVRLIAPGVDALRDKLWGNPHAFDHRAMAGSSHGGGVGAVASLRDRE